MVFLDFLDLKKTVILQESGLKASLNYILEAGSLTKLYHQPQTNGEF